MALTKSARRVAISVGAAVLAVSGLAVGTQLNDETKTVVVQAPAVTAPLRATYQDVSLKVLAKLPAFDFYRGRTATQTQRDAMEQALIGVYLPELFRYATQTPSCANAAKSLAGEMSKVTGKLGPIYEDSGSEWFVPTQGRYYNTEILSLKAFQSCSLSGSGVACGHAGTMHAGLADLLDIRKDDFTNRCVRGALFTPILPAEDYSSARASLARVQYKRKMPALTATQLTLLRATHAAHEFSTNARCGVAQSGVGQSVQGAHLAYEASALTEEQHHFFRMKDFSGVADAWDEASVCKLARLQDAAHLRWANAQIAGDWRAARRADNDHQAFHIMLGMTTQLMRYQLSCPPTKTADCPTATQTAYDVLAKAP